MMKKMMESFSELGLYYHVGITTQEPQKRLKQKEGFKKCELRMYCLAYVENKRAAAYVTRRRGGDGAVAEVVEWLLRSSNQWRHPPGEQLGGQS